MKSTLNRIPILFFALFTFANCKVSVEGFGSGATNDPLRTGNACLSAASQNHERCLKEAQSDSDFVALCNAALEFEKADCANGTDKPEEPAPAPTVQCDDQESCTTECTNATGMEWFCFACCDPSQTCKTDDCIQKASG